MTNSASVPGKSSINDKGAGSSVKSSQRAQNSVRRGEQNIFEKSALLRE